MFQCDSMLENQNMLHSRLQEKSAGHDVKHHEDFDTLLGLYVLSVGTKGIGLWLYKK